MFYPAAPFRYQIPIELPSGTGGIKQDLKLVYNSNSPNGFLGIGWSLGGIPFISRDSSYPVNFDSSDHYLYEGQRLIFDGTSYHTERETYQKMEAFNLNSSDSYWIVTNKNGTKFFYGYNGGHSDYPKDSSRNAANDGHIEAVGKGGKALTWTLSRIEDVHGNYLTILYDEDIANGTFYPQLITYTKGNGLTQGFKTIEFTYESRTDHFKLYLPTLVDMDKRLAGITVKFDGNLLRKYELDYDYGTTSGLSRLVRVSQLGSDGITSQPPQEFVWEEGLNGFDSPELLIPDGTFGTDWEHWPIWGNGQGSTIATLLDMNGDGLPDRVDHHYQGTNGIHVAINNGNGFNTPTLWLPVGTFGTELEHWPILSNGQGSTIATLLDMNGDGRPGPSGSPLSGNVSEFM